MKDVYKSEKTLSTEEAEAIEQFNDIMKDVNRLNNISIFIRVFVIVAIMAVEVGVYCLAKSARGNSKTLSGLRTGSIILNGMVYTPLGIKIFNLLGNTWTFHKLKKMVKNGKVDVVEVVEKFKKAEQGIEDD